MNHLVKKYIKNNNKHVIHRGNKSKTNAKPDDTQFLILGKKMEDPHDLILL